MRVKPKVCVVDEELQVQVGWETSLSKEAALYYYKDFNELLEEAGKDEKLLPSFDCLIIGRYFKESGLDVCSSPVIDTLREKGVGAIFLNWQGYLTKEEIDSRFDGRLFNRYGVRWQTLRSRIQKIKNKKSVTGAGQAAPRKEPESLASPKSGVPVSKGDAVASFRSKPQRCQDLLRSMARKAGGRHKERLEYYASQNHQEGIALLEAIYNRLMTSSQGNTNCPSQYINSSPVVAKSILKQALFG